MLYLIKAGYYNSKTEEIGLALKIGYTKDDFSLNTRLVSYKTHNPLFNLLDTRDGDEEMESYLHNYFIKYHLPGASKEWFIYNQEIVDKFKTVSITDPYPNPELIGIPISSKNSFHIETRTVRVIVYNIFHTGNLYYDKLINEFVRKFDFSKYHKSFMRIEEDWEKVYDQIIDYCKKDYNEILSFISSNKDSISKFGINFEIPNIPSKEYFISKLKELGYCFNKTDNKDEINIFIKEFFLKYSEFTDRIKLYCEFADKYGNKKLKHINEIPKEYHEYYDIVGSKRIMSLSFQESNLKNEVSIYKSNDKIFLELKKNFIVGSRYTKKSIKSTVQGIYDSLGLKKTAKATDLQNYFDIKRCSITINGKETEGFKILSIK